MSDFQPFAKNFPKKSLLPPGAEVKEHQVPQIRDGAQISYAQVKSRFNPEIAQKSSNSRFSLSEQVAAQMALEKEDQIRFEKRVEEKLKTELNRLSTEAQEAGYKSGLEIGRKEAFDAEKLRLATQLESLAHLIQSMELAKEQLAKQYENTLLDVAFRIARAVVHYEIKERPEAISQTIAEILNRISKEDDVVIKISPNQFEALENIRKDLSQQSRSGRISFEVDEKLESGDCVVESQSGEIASFLDEKFRKLIDALVKNPVLASPTGTSGL